MTERFEITGLTLRGWLNSNPTLTQITATDQDGSEWTYRRDVGLTVRAGDRELTVPDDAFAELIERPQWELA